MTSTAIATLVWHRLDLTLTPNRSIGQKTPALIVLNALLKSVKTSAAIDAEQPAIKRAFHVPGKTAHRLLLPAGKPFSLVVQFFGGRQEDITQWQEALAHYLDTCPTAGFRISAPPRLTTQSGNTLSAAGDEDIQQAELEFLTPLPFKYPKGSQRTAITLQQLLEQISQRLKKLFGIDPEIPSVAGLQLQNQYWHYVELHHASKSQPGNTQYYNGCAGSLYLKGKLAPLLPWLRLAAAVHAGGNLALNPFGYCRLHIPARPRIDHRINKPEIWRQTYESLLAESDDWASHMAERHGAPLDPERICRNLLERISSPEWTPTASLAFTVPKRGGYRRLEKLAPEERLIQGVLHELLYDPIDRLLEPSSLGYRKGKSPQQAIDRVRELIEQGYRYAVESDIEDFFPSVDLPRLKNVLDGVLPPGDQLTRRLIEKLLHTPWLEGHHLHPRQQGLAQGSPLSPLFANLYLDRFDEAIARANGQLVRYADDFVILTRQRSEAETLLATARSELDEIGLNLASEKTAIVDIADGFRFLGQPFGGQASEAAAPLLAPPVRKTLYLTEPHLFLGHNGDALEIRRQGEIVDTIPFRRLSDIVVLENACFSSGLVRKCAQHGVPLIFTLGSGYHVATLAPDSRRYHGIAERQALHYASLSATEKLIIAKGFASQKIANYQPLIRARYRPGSNALLAELDQAIAAIENATDIAAVRGHEGNAARKVFAALNGYLKVPEFHFKKRLREKPDRMNCLFNFGYYLLFSRLNTLVRAAGINPYLGFLHDGADDYETLVCDIEELFRAPLDRLLISLVNLHIIQPADFNETAQGLRLQPAAIKRFISRFEEMLHSDAGGISLLRAMEAQVTALRQYVAEGQALWYFRYQAPHAARPAESEAAAQNSDSNPITPPPWAESAENEPADEEAE